MCIEDFWKNRTGSRHANRALSTGKCALKTPGGIGHGIDPQKGALYGKCTLKTSLGIGPRLHLLSERSIQGNLHEDSRSNRTGTKLDYRALSTGKHALKTSGGIGQGLDLLIGS